MTRVEKLLTVLLALFVLSLVARAAYVDHIVYQQMIRGVQGPIWEPQYKRETVITTGYHCPPCDVGIKDDGLTATNKAVKRGHCASDWRVYPPGTEFRIPNYGPCIVEDRGRKVRGRHLDLYFSTKGEAKQWGRQVKEVWRKS